MKKTLAFSFVLLLTVALFTGCGCRNSKPMETTRPTTAPTAEPTTTPTVPSTSATTEDTAPPTIEDGNGPLSTDNTSATQDPSSTDEPMGRNGTNMPVG